MAQADRIDAESIEIGAGRLTSVHEVVTMIFDQVGSGRPLIGMLPDRLSEIEAQRADVGTTQSLLKWEACVIA